MTSIEEISRFMASDFPQCNSIVEAAGNRGASVRHEIGDNELRPGGTVSGPVMMAVADVAIYVAILGEIGIVPLAVTTSLNINFLRKPSECDLIARGNIIKMGKRLAVVEVSIYSDEDIVAHATGTYSIPPQS